MLVVFSYFVHFEKQEGGLEVFRRPDGFLI